MDSPACLLQKRILCSRSHAYDVPLEDRYSYTNGVRRFWVYNNDKPCKFDSSTRPRTEVRITVSSFSLSTCILLSSLQGILDSELAIFSFSSSEHILISNIVNHKEIRMTSIDLSFGFWSGDMTSHQEFGSLKAMLLCERDLQCHNCSNSWWCTGSRHSATKDLRWRNEILLLQWWPASDMYGKWFRVNIIHNVGEGYVSFYW